MQRLVEQGRHRLQAEFEAWRAEQQQQPQLQLQQQQQPPQQGKGKDEEASGDMEPPQRRLSSSACPLSASTTERKCLSSSPQAREAPLSSDVDDDIAAFYRAKEELLAMRRQQGREGAAGAW